MNLTIYNGCVKCHIISKVKSTRFLLIPKPELGAKMSTTNSSKIVFPHYYNGKTTLTGKQILKVLWDTYSDSQKESVANSLPSNFFEESGLSTLEDFENLKQSVFNQQIESIVAHTVEGKVISANKIVGKMMASTALFDYEIQRYGEKLHIFDIALEFTAEKENPLTVVKRGGEVYVNDGQQTSCAKMFAFACFMWANDLIDDPVDAADYVPLTYFGIEVDPAASESLVKDLGNSQFQSQNGDKRPVEFYYVWRSNLTSKNVRKKTQAHEIRRFGDILNIGFHPSGVDPSTVTDNVYYTNGEFMKDFQRKEPRSHLVQYNAGYTAAKLINSNYKGQLHGHLLLGLSRLLKECAQNADSGVHKIGNVKEDLAEKIMLDVNNRKMCQFEAAFVEQLSSIMRMVFPTLTDVNSASKVWKDNIPQFVVENGVDVENSFYDYASSSGRIQRAVFVYIAMTFRKEYGDTYADKVGIPTFSPREVEQFSNGNWYWLNQVDVISEEDLFDETFDEELEVA